MFSKFSEDVFKLKTRENERALVLDFLSAPNCFSLNIECHLDY